MAENTLFPRIDARAYHGLNFRIAQVSQPPREPSPAETQMTVRFPWAVTRCLFRGEREVSVYGLFRHTFDHETKLPPHMWRSGPRLDDYDIDVWKAIIPLWERNDYPMPKEERLPPALQRLVLTGVPGLSAYLYSLFTASWLRVRYQYEPGCQWLPVGVFEPTLHTDAPFTPRPPGAPRIEETPEGKEEIAKIARLLRENPDIKNSEIVRRYQLEQQKTLTNKQIQKRRKLALALNPDLNQP